MMDVGLLTQVKWYH